MQYGKGTLLFHKDEKIEKKFKCKFTLILYQNETFTETYPEQFGIICTAQC